ncbi:MAG: elongation factor P maturation arginine rhamnosyltransferase EarP, partial [Burkholderiales bacterium]
MRSMRSWDIFCTVVDNYGDIGVCWRLARQLAAEHGQRVRLWVDDLASLARISPGVVPGLGVQHSRGVEIRWWREPFPAVEPADVVVEAFACNPPA